MQHIVHVYTQVISLVKMPNIIHHIQHKACVTPIYIASSTTIHTTIVLIDQTHYNHTYDISQIVVHTGKRQKAIF